MPIGNSWLVLTKESRNTSLESMTYEPVICIVIQGKREVISSGEVVWAGVIDAFHGAGCYHKVEKGAGPC